jgi:hypothetical protein
MKDKMVTKCHRKVIRFMKRTALLRNFSGRKPAPEVCNDKAHTMWGKGVISLRVGQY